MTKIFNNGQLTAQLQMERQLDMSWRFYMETNAPERKAQQGLQVSSTLTVATTGEMPGFLPLTMSHGIATRGTAPADGLVVCHARGKKKYF